MQPPQPGMAPVQSASRMVRAPDGKIRSDFGDTSIITDLAARRTTILDHAKKLAHVIPMPQAQAPQFVPAAMMAGLQAPASAPMQAFQKVEDLGTSMIDGLEVVGKKYTLPAPPIPQPPRAPQMPQAPQMPAPPQIPVTTEVWTSTKLQLPVLTRTKGSFGEEVRRCRYTESAPPPPSLFQIPEGYKTITPAPPNPPGVAG